MNLRAAAQTYVFVFHAYVHLAHARPHARTAKSAMRTHVAAQTCAYATYAHASHATVSRAGTAKGAPKIRAPASETIVNVHSSANVCLVPVHPRAGSAENAMRTHVAEPTYVNVFRAFAHLAHVRLHV